MIKKNFNLTLFLDLRKAFDTVDHNILLDKLKYYGVEGKHLAWFESYLSNRTQYCSVDGHNSELRKNLAGIPRGSSLGPLLFSIYINDLPSMLENSESSLYADDTNLSTSDKILSNAQQKLNKDLETLGNWLHVNKLSANLVKTEYMIIASAHKLKSVNYSPLIMLNKKPIKRVHRTDYIGLVIDEKLSWEEKKDLCKKISSAVTAIRHVNYLPQNTLITLYYSLVESRLRYCSTVWGNCNNSLKANFQRIQNRAARIITHAKYGSVDSEALLKKLGWLNVQQLIDFNTAVMVYKSKNNTAPSYLSECFAKPSAIHSHNTRSANRAIFPTHTNAKFGQKSFTQYGSSIWNKLDREVQEIKNIDNFKKTLKKKMLAN